MSQSSKEECFEDLKRRVLTTELAPGSDLDEARLSESYGISRTPLREVLQRLAGEGVVRIEANRGAKVASMNVSDMRTFFQTAPLIYANIARLAAENRTSKQLVELKNAQRSFLEAISSEDATGAALSNHAFHDTIGNMAHNPYLSACLDRLLIDHTRLGQTFYRPAAPSEKVLILKAAEQHDAMISAIEAREAALAIDLTLQHWDLSRDRMERFVRPDPLPVEVISLEDRRDAV
ncbi:MAG: GntR family transcriptional regulator [Rhodobacteraceae bacterium]|nr:GntR family transcriptional regulator [Paracoccaceae bacterium]